MCVCVCVYSHRTVLAELFLEGVANDAGELVVPVDDVPVGLIEGVFRGRR